MTDLYLKKSLGQHFLIDDGVLRKIADAVGDMSLFKTVVEIGPGMGALTKYLLQQKHPDFYVIELDDRWAVHLSNTFPSLRGKIIHQDVLSVDFGFLQNPTHVVGNFPYNISTQIVFRIIEERQNVAQMTGMFQKEVAKRIAAKHGSKDYGIMSVMTQTYFDCEYLFDVEPQSFNPPPKVVSGVIRVKRKELIANTFDEMLYKNVVKAAFNQRRKTMRNSLKELVLDKSLLTNDVFNLRPEQLSVSDFQALTNMIQGR